MEWYLVISSSMLTADRPSLGDYQVRRFNDDFLTEGGDLWDSGADAVFFCREPQIFSSFEGASESFVHGGVGWEVDVAGRNGAGPGGV